MEAHLRIPGPEANVAVEPLSPGSQVTALSRSED